MKTPTVNWRQAAFVLFVTLTLTLAFVVTTAIFDIMGIKAAPANTLMAATTLVVATVIATAAYAKKRHETISQAVHRVIGQMADAVFGTIMLMVKALTGTNFRFAYDTFSHDDTGQHSLQKWLLDQTNLLRGRAPNYGQRTRRWPNKMHQQTSPESRQLVST